jgi:hypothetical protein
MIVLCRDEPYVSEFVNYYLHQGVDMIYILDDHSEKGLYKDVLQNKQVTVVFDKGVQTDREKLFERVNEYYKKVRHQYEWIIIVDMDEYITTKKNLSNTIRDELQTTFRDCMCVKVPWAMMACNSIRYNPTSLLKTNVYRMNNDKHHDSQLQGKYDYNSAERTWNGEEKLFQCKNLFFVNNESNLHWTVIVVQMFTRRIIHYDSLTNRRNKNKGGRMHSQKLDGILQYLEDRYEYENPGGIFNKE